LPIGVSKEAAVKNEQMTLVPYDNPQARSGSGGDWWALGKLESAVQNADGSMRTFSVEVGIGLHPHGDYLHCEDDYWQLVSEKLPAIAQQVGSKR
jgi:hypothetical protein